MAFDTHIGEEDLAAYSLGALPPEEARQVDEHLAACPACRLQANGFEAVADLLPYSVSLVKPPPALQQRVLSAVEQKPGVQRLPAWAPWVAAAALLVVLGAGTWAGVIWRRPGPVAVVESRALQLTGTAMAPGASARLVVMETRNGPTKLVLEAEGLPRLQGDAEYTMWLIRNGKRWNCGSFKVDDRGHGMLAFDNWDATSFNQVGVTMEPAPNDTDKPLGEKVLGLTT